MRERDRILRGWAALREHAAPAPPHLLEAADLKVETGFGTAKLGLNASDLPQLLLPVAPGVRRPREADVPLLQTLIQRLTDREATRPYLIVTCLDRGLEGAFADLIEAVLGRVEGGEGAVAAFISAVKDFRALFEPPAQTQVDEKRIRGLVAELLLLLRLVSLEPRAVELWFGPDKDRHDFRGGRTAIEVKSSPRESSRITISAIEQLSPPTGGTLHLRRYVLEPSGAGAVSVGDLTTQIETLGGCSRELRDRLKAMGCSDPASPDWNRVRFNVEACDTYRVVDDFPRLTASSFSSGGIPAGVSGIVYEVDLAHAAHLKLCEAQLHVLETAVLECLR